MEVRGEQQIINLLTDIYKCLKIPDAILIPYSKEYSDVIGLLQKKFPYFNFTFECIEQPETRVDSVAAVLRKLPTHLLNENVLLLDIQYHVKSSCFATWRGKNTIFAPRDLDGPMFRGQPKKQLSHLSLQNLVDLGDASMKDKLSPGSVFGFSCASAVLEIIDKGINDKSHTANLIGAMMAAGTDFNVEIILPKMITSLATPELVAQSELCFLLDLDGTLVNTDHVYGKVWNELLTPLGLCCDQNFFDDLIKGKTDNSLLTFLMPNISQEEISNIAGSKDDLFIAMLSKEDSYVNDGVLPRFFEQIKNGRIAIVTSSNRRAAEYIIRATGMDAYVDLLVAAGDVAKGKPDPMPYVHAAQVLETDMKNSIIFEDSMSGYMAAQRARPRKICLYTDGASSEIKSSQDFKFDNYHTLDVGLVCQDEIHDPLLAELNDWALTIKSHMESVPVKDIKPSPEILKTGYICDIKPYTVKYLNGQTYDIVLKLSNFGNELSKVASELDMYVCEKYFYSDLANIVGAVVKVPRCEATFEKSNKIGIVLEDIRLVGGHFDARLYNDVDMLLKVVTSIFKMHNHFYFRSVDEVIPAMRSLRTFKDITYYSTLVRERFGTFIHKVERFLTSKEYTILCAIQREYTKILGHLSSYPMSFCHGDCKAPNMFFAKNKDIYLLDWQYIMLSKGVTDLTFLLVESVPFDQQLVELSLMYYYRLSKVRTSTSQKNFLATAFHLFFSANTKYVTIHSFLTTLHYVIQYNTQDNNVDTTHEEIMRDFKLALCAFPFFVMVWFNSESSEKLLDKSFPLKFMKGILKYYNCYLDLDFFASL
jgi:HAD superfamily hydrolase (TIGR01509 family)